MFEMKKTTNEILKSMIYVSQINIKEPFHIVDIMGNMSFYRRIFNIHALCDDSIL